MADLRRFQQDTARQANLQSIPVAKEGPSPLLSLAGFAADIGTSVFKAQQGFAEAEAVSTQGKAVGAFQQKLVAAQQASLTDPTFNLERAQQKIWQETVAANPSLAAEFTKAYENATGLKVAGLSFRQKEQQDLQEEAWGAGFGGPDQSDEYNAAQLDIYQDIKREAKLMQSENTRLELEEKRGKITKEAVRTKAYEHTKNLVTKRYEGFYLDMQRDLTALSDGTKTLAEVQQEWAFKKSSWGLELNRFGEFSTDETVQSMLSPISELFDLADKSFKGEFETEALKTQIEATNTKNTALMLTKSELAGAYAVSKIFPNQPATNIIVGDALDKIIDPVTKSVKDATGLEASSIKTTLGNMGRSEDPDANEEAEVITEGVADHLDRNGDDYTDEEILKTCSVLDNKEVFEKMSPERSQKVVQACSKFAVDTADKAIRNINANSTVRLATETITPRGTTIPGTPTLLKAGDFSTLTTDGNGLRYTPTEQYTNNRQVQRVIQEMNRQLQDVNPVIRILSSASGESIEKTALDYFGVGQPEATEGAPQQVATGEEQFAEAVVNFGGTVTRIPQHIYNALEEFGASLRVPTTAEGLLQEISPKHFPKTDTETPTAQPAQDTAATAEQARSRFIESALDAGMSVEEAEAELAALSGFPATPVVPPRPLTESDQVAPVEAPATQLWEDTPAAVAKMKEGGATLEEVIANIKVFGFANEAALINQIKAAWGES